MPSLDSSQINSLRADELEALSAGAHIEYEGFEHRAEWSFQLAAYEELVKKSLPFGRYAIMFKACKTLSDVSLHACRSGTTRRSHVLSV